MDTLTHLLAWIHPGWAAQRVTAQAKLKSAQRYYEAVAITAQRPRRGNNASADAVVDNSRNYLREFGRHLDENHDLAVGVLDDLVTNIVGCGASLEPMVVRGPEREPDETLNRQLAELWAEFWQSPEVTGELPGAEMERLVCRSWLRDGEVFAQHVTKAAAPYGSRVPYALELLEADFVPYDLIDAGNRITHGVQKDGWGRPIGYYVLKNHPGNRTSVPGSRFETVYLPADRALHLKFCRRLHQTRGVSIFHAVLSRLDDLKDYEESERIAARVAAALTAYIRRDAGMNDMVTTTASEDGSTTSRSFSMEPGLIFDGLQPGEDVGLIDSKRPNPNLETFRNAMLRAVASGTGTRFSSIAKNYNGTYSAQRQELVEAVAHYRRLFDYLRQRFYLPVWRRFVDASRLAGLLRVPFGIHERSLYYPEVRGPNMPWIDPKKEIEAFAMMVESGFRSRHQVIRDLGSDPATVDAQLEADPLDIRPVYGAQVGEQTFGGSESEPKDEPKAKDENDLEEAA